MSCDAVPSCSSASASSPRLRSAHIHRATYAPRVDECRPPHSPSGQLVGTPVPYGAMPCKPLLMTRYAGTCAGDNPTSANQRRTAQCI